MKPIYFFGGKTHWRLTDSAKCPWKITKCDIRGKTHDKMWTFQGQKKPNSPFEVHISWWKHFEYNLSGWATTLIFIYRGCPRKMIARSVSSLTANICSSTGASVSGCTSWARIAGDLIHFLYFRSFEGSSGRMTLPSAFTTSGTLTKCTPSKWKPWTQCAPKKCGSKPTRSGDGKVQNTWKSQQNTVYWSKLKLSNKRVAILSNSITCNYSLKHTTNDLYREKVVCMKTCNELHFKVYRSPKLPRVALTPNPLQI